LFLGFVGRGPIMAHSVVEVMLWGLLFLVWGKLFYGGYFSSFFLFPFFAK